MDAASVGEFNTLLDDFETVNLDQGQWWTKQLLPGNFWIDQIYSRNGQHSLAIQVNSEVRGCGEDCQRNEIRTPPDRRVKFGEEAWYRFSFRIEGDFPTHENTRWVSGQWKQENGRSPFLSQRFDRGVFHIAVHDGDCRVLIAQARGGFEKLGTTIDTRKVKKHAFLANKQAYQCDTDIVIEPGENPLLPNPYKNWVDMTYRLRGGLNGNGLIDIWANNRFIVRVRGSIGHHEMSGPNQYFKFGIYRDFMPGTAVVYFDDFQRTKNKIK